MENIAISLKRNDYSRIRLKGWQFDFAGRAPRAGTTDDAGTKRSAAGLDFQEWSAEDIHQWAERIRRLFRPIELVDDKLIIRGNSMIPEVVYEVLYGAELLHFIKHHDDSISVFEVTPH